MANKILIAIASVIGVTCGVMEVIDINKKLQPEVPLRYKGPFTPRVGSENIADDAQNHRLVASKDDDTYRMVGPDYFEKELDKITESFGGPYIGIRNKSISNLEKSLGGEACVYKIGIIKSPVCNMRRYGMKHTYTDIITITADNNTPLKFIYIGRRWKFIQEDEFEEYMGMIICNETTDVCIY
jgi:hypothetical protein